MNTRLLLLLTFLSSHCFAQTDPALDTYLASHRYAIRLEKDSSTSFDDARIPAMLDRAMLGKQMFVYGEGFSHALELNANLRRTFLRHFASRGLKYYFEESPRSWVVAINMHVADDLKLDSYYSKSIPYSKRYYREEKLLRVGPVNFEYAATDFERKNSFHYVLGMISSEVGKAYMPRLLELAPYMQDTSYLSLSRRKFVKFYRTQRDRFLADSNSFKSVLGNVYPHFRYLMSDPLPASYDGNRNGNMARHILMQVGDARRGEVYLLRIGNGHIMYRDGLRKTTLGVLRDSRQLNNKILVSNIYCENCSLKDRPGEGDNGGLRYIKGPVLESFRKAASNEITLFDLTELPPQLQYLTTKSDLLIFAKGMQ